MERVLNKYDCCLVQFGLIAGVEHEEGQWRMEGDEVMLLTLVCISETGTKT